jgi:hypothetical protein
LVQLRTRQNTGLKAGRKQNLAIIQANRRRAGTHVIHAAFDREKSGRGVV